MVLPGLVLEVGPGGLSTFWDHSVPALWISVVVFYHCYI
jgi:hypothetical protein